jgi:hypothetical protein
MHVEIRAGKAAWHYISRDLAEIEIRFRQPDVRWAAVQRRRRVVARDWQRRAERSYEPDVRIARIRLSDGGILNAEDRAAVAI